MKTCKHCGAQNNDDLSYCAICSQPLETGGDYKTVALLALIFGAVGFLINPFYLVSIAAIVLGVIGHVNSVNYKQRAMVGWILGVASCVVQFLIDIFCTLGFGIFC